MPNCASGLKLRHRPVAGSRFIERFVVFVRSRFFFDGLQRRLIIRRGGHLDRVKVKPVCDTWHISAQFYKHINELGHLLLSEQADLQGHLFASGSQSIVSSLCS